MGAMMAALAAAVDERTRTYPYFVNGKWRQSASGRTMDVLSPLDGAPLVGRVHACTREEVDEAIRGAHQAYRAWNRRTVSERADILNRAAERIRAEKKRLCALLSLEIAKNRAEAEAEVTRTANLVHYFAEEGRRYYGEIIWGDSFPGYSREKLCLVYREPHGVVLAIGPFNYPLPVISDASADKVWKLIEDALAKGALPLVGPAGQGRLIGPTLLDRVTEAMDIAWIEPFGPLLPIIRVKDLADAIRVANASELGLQSCVFMRDIDRAFHVGRELEVGTGNVNGADSRGPDHFPFMGCKSSGMETQGIHYSISAMVRDRAITLNLRAPR